MQALIDRLRQLGEITDEQIHQLERLKRRPRSYTRGAVVRRCDESSRSVFCIVDGWALRCRILSDGQRQILSLLLPGDMCDMQAIVGAENDHHIIALTELEIEECDAAAFEGVVGADRALIQLFLLSKVQEESLLREQVVRLGRRKARERVLHLLVELYHRQRLTGREHPERMAYAINRETFADILGLSPVHVSRSLAALARAGVISVNKGCVELRDPERAGELCSFDAAYLHVTPEPEPALQKAAQA